MANHTLLCNLYALHFYFVRGFRLICFGSFSKYNVNMKYIVTTYTLKYCHLKKKLIEYFDE